MIASIFQDSQSQIVAGHRLGHLNGLARPLAFIIPEEKNAILPYWSAQGATKGIANQFAGDIRLAIGNLGALVKPVIGLADV